MQGSGVGYLNRASDVGREMTKERDTMKRTVASNIPRYFVYTALKGFGFGLFVAVWVIFLQEKRGLSLSQAALIDVTFFVAAAIAEVPTGIVADRFGRKTSMTAGAALMSLGILGWTVAPTLPLIMLAYVAMGVGITFLSGAEDAFFYETLQVTGRGDDYTRLLGRVSAVFPAALAFGSVASGFLAAIDVVLPFLIAGLVLLITLGIVLTFREPQTDKPADGQARPSFGEVLRQSLTLLRARPTLRYPILYLAIVPLASFMIESVFVQPQALALGVPIAGIGLIVMAVQLTNMVGSAWSNRVTARFGEGRVLYTAPMVIGSSLLLLAALQVLPALLLIALMGFLTAVVRPIMLSRIQEELSDDVRATMLSMQSLTFTIVAAISQPSLGAVADHWGLPAAYIALAASVSLLMVVLFAKSRQHCPQPVMVPCPAQVLEQVADSKLR
jgi:MFS family permease